MADNIWTPRRIASWLRRSRDWRAQLAALDAGPSVRSATDYSRPVVQGGGAGPGPAQRYVEQKEELRKRVATIDWWLGTLSELERLAAEYWIRDEEGTITEVALAAGLDWRQAKQLVHAVPLIIWGRCYYSEREVV